MFRSDYCCVGLPLYNVGIYAILAQFAVIGIVAGALALASPSVLAIAVPSFMTVIFGVLCLAIAALQLIGFWGVFKEKAAAFRKYVRVNVALVVVTALYALAVIILSAARHSTAVAHCLVQFNANSNSSSSSGAEVIQGSSLCNIWTWAQLGVCGFLFLLLVASETYFCLMQRIWSTDQRRDHQQYRTLVSAARESIALRPSGDWDSTSRRNSSASDDGAGRAAPAPFAGRPAAPKATPSEGSVYSVPTLGNTAGHYGGRYGASSSTSLAQTPAPRDGGYPQQQHQQAYYSAWEGAEGYQYPGSRPRRQPY